MLKIRKCAIVMNDSKALSGGTTISMSRLKQILASHLSELDGLTGRIHIKKLTLDLGALTQMEFDKDFFDRFEQVCGKFKEKLIALHHDQQADISSDDEEKLQYIMDHLYSIEQTENVRKFQRFIESLKKAPTRNELNELQRAYAKQFSQAMPTEMLDMLKKLLSEIETSSQFLVISKQAIAAKNQPFGDDFEQKHLDYLLFLLENTRIDNHWLEQISRSFEKKHRRSIPSDLLKTLKNTFDDFQWGNVPKNNSAEKRYLNEVEIDSLKDYLDLHGEESERNALVQLVKIDQNKASENTWFVQLLADYTHRFKTRMPASLQEQLLRYNAWKKKRSWDQIDQLERDLLKKKLQEDEVEKHSSKNRSNQKNRRGISEKEYAFIIELLEKTAINAAWFSQIANAFNKEFGRKIPKTIEDHLLTFSANLGSEKSTDHGGIINDWRTYPDWKTALVNHLRQYPEMGIFSDLLTEHLPLEELNLENWQEKFFEAYHNHTAEQPTRAQRIILRKFKRQQKENACKELFSFGQKDWVQALKTVGFPSEKLTVKEKNLLYKEIIKVFQEVAFSESWMADVKVAYETHFKSKMPEKLLRVLIDVANNRLDAFDKTRNQMSEHSKREQISLIELKKSLQREPSSEELDELLFILPDANERQKFSEIQHIISGFEVYYSKPISAKLRKLLFAFYKESKKQSTEVRLNDDLEFLEVALTEQLNPKEKNHPKESDRSIVNEIKQLLSIIDDVQLTHRWKIEIERLYQKHFGTGFSKELNQILEDFSKTIEGKSQTNLPDEQSRLFESQSISVQEWSEYLKANLEIYGVEQILQILSSWNDREMLDIQQLTEVYEEELSQRLPMGLNALLFAFLEKNQSSFSKSTPVQNRNLLVESLMAQMKEIESSESVQKPLVQEEEMLFFQSMLESFSMDASWLPRAIKEYEIVFGRKITVRLRDALFAFTQQIKSSFDERTTEKKTARNSIMHLERFLTQQEDKHGVRQLLELVRKSKGLEKSGWFSVLLNEYRDHFQEEMPVSCQELLLNYSADFEWNTWKMAPAKMRSQLISNVKPELIKLSQESDVTDKNRTKGIEELSFLLSLLEVTPLNASWLATIMKQFKLKFNRELSASIKQLLMDFSVQLFAEIPAQLTINESSSDHFFHTMIADYLANDLSEIEMEWIRALFLKSKKSGKQNNWIARFVEICAKNGHQLSEKTREQLVQFDTYWHNALKISNGEQLHKVLGVLVSNYFVKIRSSRDEPSPDELEKECFALEFVREINDRQFVDFIAEWKERFQEEIDRELKGILSEYGMAIRLAEEKQDLVNEHPELGVESVDASLNSEIQQTQNESEIEKEYLVAMSQKLMDGWINKSDLEKGYRQAFGKELEEELNSIFEEIAERESKVTQLILSEFRAFLEKLEPTKSVREMLELLDEEMLFSTENWFEELLKTYADRRKEVMPFSHQQLLLNFAQTRKSEPQNVNSFAGQNTHQRTLLVKKWNEFLTNQPRVEINARKVNWEEQSEFIADYLESHNLDADGLELLKKIVYAKFKQEIYPEWLSFLIEQERSISSKKKEQLHELGGNKLRNFQENIIARIEKLPESRETTELIGLVKESDALTVDNWFQQLLQAYFKTYASQMPAGHQSILLGIAQEEKFFKEESEAVLDEQKVIELKAQTQQKIEKYFASHSNKNEKNISGVLDQIIDNCLNKSLEENWIVSFSANYEQHFKRNIPKELQEMLETISIEPEKNHEIRKTNERSLKNEVEKKIEDFFATKFEQLPMRRVYLDFLLEYLQNPKDDTSSTEKLVAEFKEKFGVEFPKEAMQFIIRWTEKNTPKSQLLELETNLERVLEKEVSSSKLVDQTTEKSREIRKTVVRNVIDRCLNESLEENWITSFSANYEKLFKKRVPKELQEMLETISTETEKNQEIRNTNERSLKNEVEKKIEDFFQSKFEQLPMRRVYLDFILEYLQNPKDDTSSTDKLVAEFKEKFGVEFPKEAMQFIIRWTEKNTPKSQLLELETNLERVLEKEVSSSESVDQITEKSREIRKTVVRNVIENCLNESLEENWIISFSANYEKLFKEHVPKELQEMLETISIETGKNQQARNTNERSLKNEVAKSIEHFFRENSNELPAQKAYENFIVEYLEKDVLTASRKGQLKTQFEETFGIHLPENMSQLVDRTIAEANNNAENQVEFLKKELSEGVGKKSSSDEIMPSSLRRKRNHLPSNKVKLLKLKETLKQLQKGKKEDPDIAVSNAGIVIGWVLWKSIFTQFGWLQEGKFIRTESLDARQMAASWLHLSVGEDPINANPLILFMCGIEEYEINPMTKEQLQEQLGSTNIDTSINDYYEMLLSMWPIFEPNQIGDLMELFIRREGLMKPTGLGMKLKLVKEPYDLLMDRNPIPWPISLINFSWTTSIIEVEW